MTERAHPGRWWQHGADCVDIENNCQSARAAAGDHDVSSGGKALLQEVEEHGVAYVAAVVVYASVVDDSGSAVESFGVGLGLEALGLMFCWRLGV